MFLSPSNLLFLAERQTFLAKGHKEHQAKPSFHPFTSSSFHLFPLSLFHLSPSFHPFTSSSFHPFTSSSFHLFTFSPFHPSSSFHSFTFSPFFIFSPFHFFTFSPFLESIPQLHPHLRIVRIHGKHARIGMKIVISCGKTNLVVKVVLTRKAIEYTPMRYVNVSKGRKG